MLRAMLLQWEFTRVTGLSPKVSLVFKNLFRNVPTPKSGLFGAVFSRHSVQTNVGFMNLSARGLFKFWHDGGGLVISLPHGIYCIGTLFPNIPPTNEKDPTNSLHDANMIAKTHYLGMLSRSTLWISKMAGTCLTRPIFRPHQLKIWLSTSVITLMHFPTMKLFFSNVLSFFAALYPTFAKK